MVLQLAARRLLVEFREILAQVGLIRSAVDGNSPGLRLESKGLPQANARKLDDGAQALGVEVQPDLGEVA